MSEARRSSPLTQKIREMLRDPTTLARMREIFETAPPDLLSEDERTHYLKLIETIEQEIAEDPSTKPN